MSLSEIDSAQPLRGLASEPDPPPSLQELTTAEPLGEDGALILGDGPLDLQQELVLGIIGDRAVEENDLAARFTELFQKQDLISILTRQSVGTVNRDDVEVAAEGCVPQSVQAGPIEAGARAA